MKRKEKENLIQEIGMKFDEATALFSEETLQSMAMNDVAGGTGSTQFDDCPGSGSQMTCPQQIGCSGSGSSGGSSVPSTSGSTSNSGSTGW